MVEKPIVLAVFLAVGSSISWLVLYGIPKWYQDRGGRSADVGGDSDG